MEGDGEDRSILVSEWAGTCDSAFANMQSTKF